MASTTAPHSPSGSTNQTAVRAAQRCALSLAALAIFLLPPMPVAALVTVGTLDYRKDGYEIDVGNGAVCLINPMSIYSIEIRNELAYVVGYEGFRIIDVSDPTEPTELGALEIGPQIQGARLAVESGIAYIPNRSSLQLIDVADPANPRLIGVFETGANLISVVVANSTVYLNQAGAGILIVDVSDPQTPVEIGSIETPDSSTLLEIVGDRAYVFDNTDRVLIFDVSVPSAPVELGSFAARQDIYDLVVVGGLAYVSGRFNLSVVDVSDPHMPVEIGALGRTAIIKHLEVVGEIAYELDLGGGLSVVDVSDPSEPVLSGSIATPGYSSDFEVVDGHAFVADRQWGLQVIDLSQPAYPALHPRVLDEVNEERPAAWGVAEDDELAFVAAGAALSILDVSEPTNAVEVARAELSRPAYSITLNGDFAYLLGYSSMEIFDVSNPQTPLRAGLIDLSVRIEVDEPEIQEFQVVDGFGYALSHDGIIIIDVSNAAAPREVGFIDIHAGGFEVVDGIAYIASVNGISIIDVSDPKDLVRLGNLDLHHEYSVGCYQSYVMRPQDISVVGSFAYVAQAYSGMRIVDISDPTNPVEVSSFENYVSDTKFIARNIEYGNGILVVKTPQRSDGVWIFNIDDPMMPRLMGRIPLPGPPYYHIRNIAVGEEGRLYLATVSDYGPQVGVVVVDLGPEYRSGTALSDAFQCYSARTSSRPSLLGAAQVDLSDTFGDSAERIGRVREFCAPVDVDGFGITDSGANLSCHDLMGPSFGELLRHRQRGATLQPRWETFDVIVDNEFGDGQVLTVHEPEQLCVASTVERRDARVAPADHSRLPLDHFQCYGVEPSGGVPSFDPFEVSLSDFFGDAVRRVGDPTRLCAPVDVDGESVVDFDRHLTCYAVEDVDRRTRHRHTRLLTSNRFGNEQRMTVRGARTVCVPSDLALP